MAMLQLALVVVLAGAAQAQLCRVDIVFMFDTSSSQRSAFDRQRQLVRSLADLLHVQPGKHRVALVSYSGSTYKIRRFGFEEHNSTDEFLRQLDSVPYLSGTTHTGRALGVVQDLLKTRHCSTATLLVALTDGYSTDDFSAAAREVKELPYLQSFAISIANGFNERDLKLLATGENNVLVPPNVERKARDALRDLLRCDDKVAERFKKSGDNSKPQRIGADCFQPTVNECADTSLNDCDARATCVDLPDGYQCSCPSGTKDKSPQVNTKPGRICQPLVNECGDDRLNDCHVDALCRDTEKGYECVCKPGFQDLSKPSAGAGRACEPLVNECSDVALNDCDPIGAVCADFPRPQRYECACKPGFVDRSALIERAPGRKCVPLLDECGSELLNNCHPRAKCIDLEVGYECHCEEGFKDVSPDFGKPGRQCLQLVDECASNSTNDCDQQNGLCVDTEKGYECSCNPGTVDRSPDTSKPGRQCIQPVNECALDHDCHPLAHCIDEESGYTCYCPSETTDKSPDPDTLPGRICEPFLNHCENRASNDCHSHAVCLQEDNTYLCVCPDGYRDDSPDKVNKPGRMCRLLVDECKSQSLNECDQNAVCHDLEEGYSCTCPTNSIDESARFGAPAGRVCRLEVNECANPRHNDCDKTYATCIDRPTGYDCECHPDTRDVLAAIGLPPGRKCSPLVNECSHVLLNDCDKVQARCIDLLDGYTCECNEGSQDLSPNVSSLPGRKCAPRLNECETQLNDCSAFADCINTIDGHICRCKENYHDHDPHNPGRRCSLIIDECAASNLNDCSRYADCIDTPGGYECRCRLPYYDVSPDATKTGRMCRFNECTRPDMNTCHGRFGQRCVDTDQGYVCVCATGFYDAAPGQGVDRNCLPLSTSTRAPPTTSTTRLPSHLLPCGAALFCRRDWLEVCRLGTTGAAECVCRHGFGRQANEGPCVESGAPVWLPVVVSQRGNTPLLYATNVHGNPEDPVTRDINAVFIQGFLEHISRTSLSPHMLAASVDSIKPPALYNSGTSGGLLFNVTFVPTADSPYRSQCALYGVLLQSLKQQGELGGSGLRVGDWQMDVCAPPPPKCGQSVCQRKLAEVCSHAAGVCMCPGGYKRRHYDEVCKRAVGIPMSILVERRGSTYLQFYPELNDPTKLGSKQLADLFLSGLRQSYGATRFAPSFVNVELNTIEDPTSINSSWHGGAVFTFTAYFEPNAVRRPSDAWDELVSATAANSHELGSTNLFLKPEQVSSFSACFRTNCDATAICTPSSGNSGYTCTCPDDFTDLNPELPGTKCQSKYNVNECIIGPNDCDPSFARCVNLPYLYECQCSPGFKDANPTGRKGTSCVRDRCYKELTCPKNSTCSTGPNGAPFCTCLDGCLAASDVDECALGLNDCSAAAECTDLEFGFSCRCPYGFSDPLQGDIVLGGRLCSAPLCDRCNARGDCVTDLESKRIVCKCHMDFSGDFCEVAAAGAFTRLYVLIILATIFLLCALTCCCFLCCRAMCMVDRRAALLQWYHRPLHMLRYAVASSGIVTTSVDNSGMSSLVTASTAVTPSRMKIPRPHVITPLNYSKAGSVALHEDVQRWKDYQLAQTAAAPPPVQSDMQSKLNASLDNGLDLSGEEETVVRRVVTTHVARSVSRI